MKKKWYRSKTIWVNLIGVVVIIISAFYSDELAQEVLGAEAGILLLINLGLRIITNQGLEK